MNLIWKRILSLSMALIGLLCLNHIIHYQWERNKEGRSHTASNTLRPAKYVIDELLPNTETKTKLGVQGRHKTVVKENYRDTIDVKHRSNSKDKKPKDKPTPKKKTKKEEAEDIKRTLHNRRLQDIDRRRREGIKDKLKTIIFWTTQFGSDTWWNIDELGREPFFKHQCGENKCILTRDRKLLNEASMLVFFNEDPPDWPKVRNPRHLYVHSIHEPPGPHYYFLPKYDGMINMTMNYRLDADISVPYQNYVPLPDLKVVKGVYHPRNPLSGRNRSVVWPVSHCGAASGRDDYVKELSKYIDVDIIGECGNLTCERKIWNTCYFAWEQQYRFYLSFENNYCQDYVTEKLFGTLSFELVPVVFGKADYRDLAPPHSVIDVRDFKSPKDLAAYLHYLADNPVKYTEYFQWKNTWEIEDGYVFKQICKLCAAVHNPRFRNKPARVNYNSWFQNNTCDNNIVSEWGLDW